jgi:hypothetical protein
MADTATSATEAKSKGAVVKPEKPDEAAFKKGEEELKKAYQTKKDALVSEQIIPHLSSSRLTTRSIGCGEG